MFQGFLEILGGVESREQHGLNLFVLFLFGMVLVGFEVSDGQAFDHGLNRSRAAFALARQEDKLFHAAGFQVTQSGPGDFPQVANRELVGLARTDDQQALGVQAFGEMHEDRLERLAGDFTAGRQRGNTAIHGGVDVRKNSIDFLVLVEYVGYERVGMN